MILRVDPTSPVPPFEQLRDQITTMVLTNRLSAGTRLPPIRQLAADLGLAPGTVARSYRELEASHLVVSRGRHGTFTLAAEQRPVPHDRDQRLGDAARQYAVRAHQLGVSRHDAVDAVVAALDALDQGTSTTRPNARRSSM